ncbi:MBL fold metallo-hydrolase [uncultured Azohydromonas sp.]|uniref:MBL fold metallo-hydrolase n=1 Tax=uncultured Azohydromonas sp. TaxID=487342 RepID=UPI00261ED5A8|nr:MBL fold metallo-hydrolase [uncultured Azohydromonas sp.]
MNHRYTPARALPRLALAAALVMAAGAAQAGRLGVFTSDAKGFDTHTFYYDDGQEVVLIDTQFVPELTQAMVRQVRQETKSPITRVIVTHPNPDKFNGLAWLHQQGVASISSAGVAEALPAVHAYKKAFWTQTMKAFTPESYPAYADIQQRFSGAQHTLKLKSGETLTLFALRNPGVATQQVAVRIDATGDLVVGDLVHHKAHAWLEGGLVNGRPTPRIDRWIAALDELPPLSAGHPQAKVYGGRGEFAPVAEAVRAQQDYLRRSRQVVQDYVAGLGPRSRELSDAKAASAHHEALEQRVAAAFPDYKLPYMVRYSVYGLAQASVDSARVSTAAVAP